MDTKAMFEEKRKFSRSNVPGLKVSFKLLDPRTYSTYHEKILEAAANISLGGLALKTKNELPVNGPIGLDIKISPEHKSIRAFGRIAWIQRSSPQSSDFDLGISFSWWNNDEDKKLVYNVIKNQEA
ncbi:MAG: PilZ domain-containing protein [Candidatus Omnitrophica bacterium]|nr:PilZ domain-containing protein [Candidatus Omnitrophota bacterium]